MSTYESYFDLVPQDGLSLEEAQAIFDVIEAAEAFVETTGGGKAYIAEWWRLKEAIEALQEVEQ